MAMGKLGGLELNYSSDIDLVVFYEEEKFPFLLRGDKRGAVEIGPRRRQENEFRIGRLPKQKIADPGLSSGSNQQVGIGQFMGAQKSLQFAFLQRIHGALRMHLLPFLQSLQNVPLSTVIQGDRQVKAIMATGGLFGLIDPVTQIVAQTIPIADDTQPYARFLQIAQLLAQVLDKKVHQFAYFIWRAAPVFGTESKQSQMTGTAAHARLHHFAHHGGAFHVADRPR